MQHAHGAAMPHSSFTQIKEGSYYKVLSDSSNIDDDPISSVERLNLTRHEEVMTA